jgi:hypothetical protein
VYALLFELGLALSVSIDLWKLPSYVIDEAVAVLPSFLKVLLELRNLKIKDIFKILKTDDDLN